MSLLEQIANYIVEETKIYKSYNSISYGNKNVITIRILHPNVFIRVSTEGVNVKHWPVGGGVTPIIMDFDYGDPTMIDIIVNKLEEWNVGLKHLTEST